METRELVAKAEPMVRRTGVKYGTRRLESETGSSRQAELETGRPEADQSTRMVLTEGELRDYQVPAETELRNRLA